MAGIITRIEIKDFLAFKGEFAAEFCPGVNVLIGENGSGKTTLMKVMYRLCTSGKNGKSRHTERFFFSADSWQEEFRDRPFEYIKMKATIDGTESRICLKSLRCMIMDEGGGDAVIKNGEWVLYDDGYIEEFTKSHQTIAGDSQDELEFTSDNYKALESIYIPDKDMLSQSRGLLEMLDSYEMDFDATQVDILRYARRPATKEIKPNCGKVINKLGEKIDGEVIYDGERFSVVKNSGLKVEFAVEASGYKRLGLLWKLLRNGLLESGTVLFWDEPDASINPALIPIIVDVLMELSRNGVQIFLATHAYNLMKYFSMARKADDHVAFYSLCKTENGIVCDREEDYDLLTHNAIIDAEIKLLEDEIEGIRV
jgi:AAA15 family ATPase/GTPase